MARNDAVEALRDVDDSIQQCYWAAPDRATQQSLAVAHQKLFNTITKLNQDDLESRTDEFRVAVDGAKATLADLRALAAEIATVVSHTNAVESLVNTIGKAAMSLEAL